MRLDLGFLAVVQIWIREKKPTPHFCGKSNRFFDFFQYVLIGAPIDPILIPNYL